MKTIYDVIVEPLMTEKGAVQKEQDKYLFKVDRKATKNEISTAIQKIFNVHVIKVHTMNVRGRLKRVRYQPGFTASWKKAIVTLKKGESLDLTA